MANSLNAKTTHTVVTHTDNPHNKEMTMPSFGSKSKAALAKCHPLLQDIANEAIKEIDFMVLDATRGRVAQERAFAGGQSKARFGCRINN